MSSYPIAGHNLHDGTGHPVVEGAVMFWTEALPAQLERKVDQRKTALLWDPRDPTMVLGLSRAVFDVESVEYHRAHGGHAKITPHRGTLVVRAHTKKRNPFKRARREQGFMLSHRINGSEPGHLPPPPYVDGEVKVRRECYDLHHDLDAELAATLLGEGRDLVPAGDYNRHGGSVFPPRLHITERGEGADRACGGPTVRLGAMHWGPRRGSDHPSWRTTVAEL